MTLRSITITEELQDYLVAHGTPPDEVARDLAEETRTKFPNSANMQIAPDQGAFLTMLVRLLGARQAVEVGTFTGYSALAVARGLGPGGHLLCCDVNEEWTAIARRYWRRAGVEDRIELRLADARETLRSLPEEPYLDFAFVDADKEGYVGYWEALVPRMRVGGLIAVDNVLWSGRVVAPEPDTTAAVVAAFNEHARADNRVERVILPIADGLLLARKR